MSTASCVTAEMAIRCGVRYGVGVLERVRERERETKAGCERVRENGEEVCALAVIDTAMSSGAKVVARRTIVVVPIDIRRPSNCPPSAPLETIAV